MGDGADREGRIIAGVVRLAFIVVVVGIWIAAAIDFGEDDASSGASERVVWQSYDVAIDVREDGTLHVVERQEVAFDGEFSEGYAAIPLDRVGSIERVQVATEARPRDRDDNSFLDREELASQGEMIESREVPESQYTGEAGTHHATVEHGELVIEYGFESTGSTFGSYGSDPQERTIVLEYDVTGAIRDYPEADDPWQQLHWMAISRELTGIADIRRATVSIALPEAVPAEELAYAPEPETIEGATLTWPARALGEGDAYDVQVAFPAITAATAPGWQPVADARDDAAEARDNRKALGGMLLIGAGVLAAVGGGLGLLYVWQTRIREPLASPPPDIVTAPPGDLPAGLVGSLVDEEVHPRDLAATVMDLGRRGIIRISEDGQGPETPFGGRARYGIELQQPIQTAAPFEQVVLRSVFRQGAGVGATASFNDLRPLFGAYREEIQQAIDAELVQRGLYAELPDTSRHRWQVFLKGFLGMTVVLAIAILVWTRAWSWLAVLPPLFGLVILFAGRRLTPSMARKTREGAEVAAMWKAFQRHLESSQWSSFANERESVSQKYLPWVIAFGIDHMWLRRMNTEAPVYVPATAPASPVSDSPWEWRRPASQRRSDTYGHGGTWQWGDTTPGGSSLSGSGGGWNWDPGRWSDLQGSSDRMLGAAQGGSNSFFSMLGDAMEALGSGGGSGSGSSYRSGGGRSSSRSGGGRSRSSSGGGRRGFR